MLLKTSTMALAATLAIFSASAAAKAGDTKLDLNTSRGGFLEQKVEVRGTDNSCMEVPLSQNRDLAIHVGDSGTGKAELTIKSRSLGYARQEIVLRPSFNIRIDGETYQCSTFGSGSDFDCRAYRDRSLGYVRQNINIPSTAMEDDGTLTNQR
ncbi:MAG: hypothetical protein AAF530_23895 [Pseudomonadota bacterium]